MQTAGVILHPTTDRKREAHPRENGDKSFFHPQDAHRVVFPPLPGMGGGWRQFYSLGSWRTVREEMLPGKLLACQRVEKEEKSPALMISNLNIPKLQEGRVTDCSAPQNQDDAQVFHAHHCFPLHLLLEIALVFPRPLLHLSLPPSQCLCQFTSPNPFIPLL